MRSLLIVALLAACTSTPDYGPPTSTTAISLTKDGGFAPPGVGGSSVKIVGTIATYTSGSATMTATITTADVASIISAMQNIDFLDLKGDYSTCTTPATDAPTSHIVATVDAGSNDLSFYTGCSGGTFDDLAALEKTIFDLSGYTAWVAAN